MTRSAASRRIGVISDTHGLVRPEALAALQGCERILHGGDICGTHVLDELSRIAPVTAVRGNNDRGAWAQAIPDIEAVEIGATSIYMVHDIADVAIEPAAAGFGVVVTGHSHRPVCEERDGVLWLNPGSAGPRRFSLPVTLAILEIGDRTVQATLVDLLAGAAR